MSSSDHIIKFQTSPTKLIEKSSPPRKILKNGSSFENCRNISSNHQNGLRKILTNGENNIDDVLKTNAIKRKSQTDSSLPIKKPNIFKPKQTSNSMDTTSDFIEPDQTSNMSTTENFNSAPNSTVPSGEIDESLYSRQLYVLGADAMKRMQNSRVFVSGLRAVGVELAKNVILGGVKSMTIHDPNQPNQYDLSAQYYISESDLSTGKSRGEICLPKLAELNSYVPLTLEKSKNLSLEILQNFDVVVLSEANSYQERLDIGQLCHDNNIKFINIQLAGLAGGIFCDFGENHTIYDPNGEANKSVMVSKIYKEDETKPVWLVSCLDEHRHGFSSDDFINFKEVVGLENLDKNFKISKIKGPYSFEIEDENISGTYQSGGIASQVKIPTIVKYKSIKQMDSNPECMISDFAKFERPQQLHSWFKLLDKYGEPTNLEQATELVEKDENLPKNVFIPLSLTCKGQLVAMSAVLGSMAAQEVMKAISGKFTPINQYYYFDAIECLGDETTIPKDLSHEPSRYVGQTCVFGKEFQEKINAANIFLVGSGAIGCELLKCLAMMGVASNGGQLTVTDMDTIEKSNLNRQFLFRAWDVGQLKSNCAAKAVKAMNPHVNIVAHQNRVGENSEDIYNDDFFNNLTCVTNALDNVEARTYMDRRCVYYRKPLFESGTLGTMGNVQVVLPDLTESYSSSQDPPEKGIPICTLKNFPNAIEHTLQWARDEFDGLFRLPADIANQYLTDKDAFFERTLKLPGTEPVSTLNTVYDALVKDKPNNFTDCVKWARKYFEKQYSNQIIQLLHNFPPDQLTSSGQKFWSGPKRCPKAAGFDINNSTHYEYLVALSYLRAEMYGIDRPKMEKNNFESIIGEMKIEKFVAQAGVKIAANDQEAQSENQNASLDDDEFELVKNKLPSVDNFGKNYQMIALDFEKDDDSNRHIDFIVACSNNRAWNYSIEPANRLQSKKIAGKIIPAIATTTALVVGLVGIEFYKFINGCKKIESYKNGFINLALPYTGFSEPIACKKEKYYDVEWTLWDRFDVNGIKQDNSELTLQEFITKMETEHKFTISMISSGVSMLYAFWAPKKDRLATPLSTVIQNIGKRKFGDHEKFVVIEMCVTDSEDNDLEIPYVRYQFRN